MDAYRAAVAAVLKSVVPIVTMSRDGLVIQGLGTGQNVNPDYETSTSALARGHLDLREHNGGIIGAIEAHTRRIPVLLFSGDSIVGGLQNRIINVTVWLPPVSATVLPVTCLEAHRWNDGTVFAPGEKIDYALRSGMALHITARMAQAPEGAPVHQRYAADQGAVWGEIDARQQRAAFHAPTGALHDLYQHQAAEIGGISEAFPVPAGATGISVAFGGVLHAVELFDSPVTLQEEWPRLIRAAAFAWADHQQAVALHQLPAPAHRHPDDGALGRMLARAAKALAAATVAPSVGVGHDVRMGYHKLNGAALIVDGRPVHMELFRGQP